MANIVVDQTIRSTLIEHFDVRLDYQSEYMNVTPFSEESYPAFRDYLGKKYAGIRFDVIVAVADDAIRFVRASAAEVFPGVPLILWGGRSVFENWGSGPTVTGVLEPRIEEALREAVGFIRSLQPRARHVFVVSGATPFDRGREIIARQQLGTNQGDIAITYLAGLTLEDLEERLKSLPRESAVLFLSMGQDGAGKTLVTRDVLSQLASTTNAPIYALAGSNMGLGILAAVFIDQQNMAREAAEIIQRVLRGENVKDIPIRTSRRASIVDWRQLRRWNIDEGRLPPGTDVRYKEPPLWDIYKWHIAGAISLFTLQAALIVALLIQQARRKRAEAAAISNQMLLQSTIDALDAHIALLDENADIVAVNGAWRRYAEANGYAGSGFGVGRNYLEICESSGSEEARSVSQAIRAVLNGEREDLRYVYECSHSGNECWFQLRANRFFSQGVLRLAVAHVNITEIKRAHNTQQQVTGMVLRAQDEERRRIARDLHDVTVQNLAAMKANLTQTRIAAGNLEAQTMKSIDENVFLCDQVIQELRTLSYLLHPPLLDEVGLVAALQWYVRGFAQRSGIKVDMKVNEQIGRLPTDVETALFRVVQESLTNIHRHSGSRCAIIWVSKAEGSVVVRVQDDGHGMPEAASNSQETVQSLGVGILGMRERLRQLGGRLEIESGPQGTTITARVPILEERYAALSGSR